MSSETTHALFEVARLIGAGVVGGLIGSYATHRFTVRRERDSGRSNRKRELRTFVLRFKSESLAEAYPHLPNLDRQRSFAAFYRQKKHELQSAASNIENDLRGKQRAEFDQLVATATGFTSEEVIKNGKQPVVAALDELVRFLE
jgi:hypothetical protein